MTQAVRHGLRLMLIVALGHTWSGAVAARVPSSPSAHERLAQPNTKPWGAIRGRVIAADTGAPIRGAIVQVLTSTSPLSRVSVTSDSDGRFVLSGVPPGTHQVMASKAGFVDAAQATRYRRERESSRHVDVRAGQVAELPDIVLTRGGVLTGRVLDEFGEPMVGASVTVGRPLPVAPWFGPVALGASTDDRGQYRIAGLPPGAYLVQASVRPFISSTSGTPYRPVLFPGRFTVADAERVMVRAGEETSSVDISLARQRLFVVSGVALSADGRSVKLASVSLVRLDREWMGLAVERHPTVVQVDGTFRFASVEPGEYVIRMSRQIDDTFLAAATPISVVDRDISGLTISLGKAGSITGRVDLDPPGASFRMSELRASAAPLAPTTEPRPSGTVVTDEGRFSFDGLLGPTTLRLVRAPPGWRVKAVLIGDRDVTEESIDVGPGQAITDARIVLTNQLASLSGIVVDSRGARVADFSVLLFSEDRRRWSSTNGETVTIARPRPPSATGGFTVQSVLPGPYYIAAVQDVDPIDLLDPAYLERLSTMATHIVLTAEAPQQVTLKLAGLP